ACPAAPNFAAMILLEIYRRHGAWRCRLLAQGYEGGLASLATDFGVDVADPGALPDLTPSPTGSARTPHSDVPRPAVPAPAPLPLGPHHPQAPAHQAAPAPGTTRRGGLFTSRKRAQIEAENAELARLLAASGQHIEAQTAQLSQQSATSADLVARNAELQRL